MIAHFERKFTSPTETFIVNQIVAATQFDHIVFTIKNMNSLPICTQVFHPDNKRYYWDYRILNGRHRRDLEMKLKNIPVRLFHSHYLTDATL